jgi:hypothetical protein
MICWPGSNPKLLIMSIIPGGQILPLVPELEIRKIQEKVIYNVVKDTADELTAKEIVYGDLQQYVATGNSE